MLNLIDTRNAEFIAACRRLISQTPKGTPVCRADIAARAAAGPAPRYYCTYDYALRMMRVLRHGRLRLRNDRRRAMFTEIYGKVTAQQERHPWLTMPEALSRVLCSESASQFFISAATALSLAERNR